MTDWATVSSLATAGGTLVLAVATFASVRSANRSARVSELALQEQRRPVLVQSRLEDPVQKIMFGDDHWVSAAGGRGVAEHVDGTVYLAISLRNVGAGIGVLRAWHITAGRQRPRLDHAEVGQFRELTRDLYIPAGDIGIWQGALRDRDEQVHGEIRRAVSDREPVTVELMYTDQVGGQRTISRFAMTPVASQDGRQDGWLIGVVRHWYLDGGGPR